MAITISGQNNNDKILASDGVLDQISGFNVVGVMTASNLETTGELTANHIDVGSTIQLGNAGIITATTLIGNVTGNVNSTSNLLLQISGSEKFRVGNGGQLGIGGANYGTSGQVLTSGGSGSAPTWSTIASDKITEGNTEAEVYDNGSDGRFTVKTEGSERLRITQSGTVGIGSVIPANILDVQGSAHSKIHVGTTGTGHATGIQINHAKGNAALQEWQLQTDASADGNLIVRNATSGTSTMFFDADTNNVGINETSPDRKLHVGGSFIRVDDGYGLDTSGATERVTLDNGFIALTTNSLERLRIDSSGNIGQGTATPSTPDGSNADNPNNGRIFTLYGDSPAINLIHNTAGGGSAGSTDYAAINFGRNGSSTNPYRAVIGYKQVEDILHINANNHIVFDTGGNINTGERLRIDSSGKLLSGHTAALTKFHGPGSTTKRNPHIQVNGTNVNGASMSLTSWDNNVNAYYGPAIYLAKSGSSTIGTNSRVSNQNSILGSIIFSGDDGDEFVKGAMIQGAVDDTSGAQTGNNDMPGRLMFFTTADGAQVPTERLRITSTGVIQTGSKTITGGNNLAIQNFAVKGVWSGSSAIGKSIELISGYDSAVKMAAIGYNLTDVNLGSTYGGDLTFHTQPLYSSPTTPLPERMRISSAGYVTKPDTPAFIVAHSSAEVYSANSYIDGPWTVTLNRGNHFNTSNGIFTAPVAGLYQINCCQNNDYGNGSYPSNFRIMVNNSLYAGLNFDQLDSHTGWFTHVLVGTLNLARNDTVRLFTSAAARVDNYNWNHYSLYLIG